MKKILLLFFISAVIPIMLYSQMIQIIEPAILECHYNLYALKDTLKKIKMTDDLIVLRIGEKSSQCFSFYKQWEDSLLYTPEGRIVASDLFKHHLKNKTYSTSPGKKIMVEYLYKNYPDKKLTIKVPIRMKNNYEFVENYLPQEWQIMDSLKTVMGYRCQLAVCEFRGRTYQAWFTEELPVSDGPWKFNGLPGLILEVHDTEFHYHFEIAKIKKEDLLPVTYYNVWKKEAIYTDRITYLNLADEDKEHLARLKADFKGKPLEVERGEYDFMERDYYLKEQEPNQGEEEL